MLVTALAMIAGLTATSTRARAEGTRAVGPTPPRLAFIAGEVSFWRPGAEDWTPAKINTPLAVGDTLYARDGANLEMQIGSRAYVRAGSNAEIGIESLETGYLQLKVTSGHAALDLQRLPTLQRVEIDTPNGAFIIDRAGYYRLDVDDRTTFTTRRGLATVIPAGGEATDIAENSEVLLEGTESATVTESVAAAGDAWDRWNDDRDTRLTKRSRSAQYVSSDVAGVDELDRWGEWRMTRRYGHIWVPRDVSRDWVPYSTGRWVWDPYYEWTWIDDAPWGWAPYHYGRWCYTDGYWGWAPGPIVVTSVYAPALVAFVTPYVGVSVDVGIAPPFGWVALGFGEPVIPWWGPVGFVGRAYWGGWGGPHMVNDVVVNSTRIVDAAHITTFQNASVPRAVVAVPREQFGRGAVQQARLAAVDARHLEPVRGAIGVKPVAASLVASGGRGARPPERVDARSVVATRHPQDPSGRLKSAGLAPTRTASLEHARVVEPRLGPDHGAETRGGGRTAPPPPQGRGHAPSAVQSEEHPTGLGQHSSGTPAARTSRASVMSPAHERKALPGGSPHSRPNRHAAPSPSPFRQEPQRQAHHQFTQPRAHSRTGELPSHRAAEAPSHRATWPQASTHHQGSVGSHSMSTWRPPSANHMPAMSRRSMESPRAFSGRPAMAGHPGSSPTARGGGGPRGSMHSSKR